MRALLRSVLVFVGHWPLPLLHAIGCAAGMLLWWIPNGLREVTLIHMRLCLPEYSKAERFRIARRSLVESMKSVAESPAIWFGPWKRVSCWLGTDAERRAFKAAASSSKSTIWLTPHLGAWELAGQFVASFGPLTLLYKPQKGALDSLMQSGRARNPNARPVPTSAAGVKALLKALDRGEMVGMLPDHDPPYGSGSFEPFFGVSAHTMDLVGKLAARSGATVWFILAERLPRGRGFRFHIVRAPDGIQRPNESAHALNRGLEDCIRRFPDQYWWGYRRFRRRPAGAPDLYRQKSENAIL